MDSGSNRTRLIGQSQAHRNLLDTLDRVAGVDAEILIEGPTGVGKEHYATYVHEHSPRAQAPFVTVNCGAIPAELFENELFGHAGGAYTGARSASTGLVAAAENGTLFLDEIDALAQTCQVKLLRFLQQREYRRLGEAGIRRANVRIIAATNTDLERAVQEGKFRQDVYYRICVVPVRVAALSERRDDIAPLLAEFVTRYSVHYRAPRVVFSPEAMQRLMAHEWPGNVRELENCVRYLTCMQLARPVDPYDLPFVNSAVPGKADTTSPLSLKMSKRRLVDDFERQYLSAALQRANGNITRAAALSGKDRRAFFALMQKHAVRALPDAATARLVDTSEPEASARPPVS